MYDDQNIVTPYEQKCSSNLQSARGSIHKL